MRLRGGVYYADFYIDGRRVRRRLSSNVDAAREILNELRARADKAEYGLLDNNYPLEPMKDAFLKHCWQILKPATAARYASCLDRVLTDIGATRANQITHDGARSYREQRLLERVSPRTVNMEMTVLGTMLRWATSKSERLIASNPLADLEPLPHDHPKEGRALTDEEVSRLLKASPQPWRDIWYAYLVTGMRKSELVYLLFTDIDWQGREIIVRSGRAKNHRERRIPIDAGLWNILCRQRDGREARQPATAQTAAITAKVQERFSREHVFVNKMNTPLNHRSNLWRTFLRCCEAADIPTRTVDGDGREIDHVDVHSLRRTFATNLITSGADPETVRQLLGHRTLEMTMKIYTKIRNQTKRQALARLTYEQGSLAAEGVVEYPGKEGFPVPDGPVMVTSNQEREAV
jgi:integrase